MSDRIQHFSHEHALRKGRYYGLTVVCGMCYREIPTNKVFYCCGRCEYYIHIGCCELPEHIIDHSLHPLHGLKLTRRSSDDNISCHYCEKPFENNEYVYACEQLCSNFYMHMTCAMIPLPTITSDGIVQFACHQQPMTLVDQHHDTRKRGATCFGCQSNWSDPSYSCLSDGCENFLHISCAELQRKIEHPFHSPHSLILQVSKPQSCSSCCKKDCRLIFSCHVDGCHFILCTECSSLGTTIACQSHEHLLSLVEKSSCEIQCDGCQKSYENGVGIVLKIEVDYTRSFIFRCMDCVFNFHFLCGPLPSTIKYEHHMHSLVLSDHLASKDDSNEYYCDVCEGKRDESFRIYYCEECKYAAHIHCLICEILKAIKGNAKDLEVEAVGENRWDHLSKEISTRSSLNDIMNMLTDAEKERLMDPVAFTHTSLKVSRRNTYNSYRQSNARFDREGSVEDIHKIRRFYCLREGLTGDFENFLDELDYFTPEEGLLKYLDDKYVRQKVVDVDGYMVPRTMAPILKTLLRKYGRNLGAKFKSLRPAMQSIICTLLCIVIDKMCRTKVEHIAWDDIKHWYFYLKGIQRITGFTFTGRYWDPFREIVKAFLGLEAMRFEKGIREKLEAEMERCKKNLEKLKEDTSVMSDFMRECSNIASEWTQKQRTLGDSWF